MPKVLILRASVDTVDAVLTKLEQLNAKSGPFDCAVLLGHIFGKAEEAKSKTAAVPVFCTNGRELLMPDQGSHKLGSNITLLNGHGIFITSHGLRIAYVSGSSDYLEKNHESIMTTFTSLDNKNVDILLTDDWSKPFDGSREAQSKGSVLVDEIMKAVRPKYHFATNVVDLFHETLPFAWSGSDVLTRCLNVAEYNSGAKWAYAFSVSLDDNGPKPSKPSLMENPYERPVTNKRHLEQNQATEAPVKKPKQILPEECRFCFSNPKIEEHLIISIGEYAYLTTAKGPLTVPTNKMEFSGHCLVIPIKHIPKINCEDGIEYDVSASPIYLESIKYERAIAKMNFERFETCTIAFEINSENSIHYHKQVFPVAKYLVAKFSAALERQVHFNNTKYTNNAKLEFVQYNGLDNEDFRALLNDRKQNYIQFTVHEDEGVEPKVYVAQFGANERIDLQFGRRVLAFVLRLPKRAKWDSRICHQTQEEEKKDVKLFQENFKEYELSS
ncbi:LAQU0S04e05380g1_1 [Lachancea quebecensis]|uniref:LAQU0S04e05380g1_1 n=1 Tax=Lachancea quebecensis TaxID=1654605 RepID=A0A0P1KSK5_9SACH|nr:LAQU0S04e05380g1_1 [Lachancea quebecensis]